MTSFSIGTLAQMACILEAAAGKAGNVHPGRAFGDVSFIDFVLSAAAIAPAMERAGARPIGETVLEAVRATRRAVGKNTNLGIVLLLAPLAAVPRDALGSAATPAGRGSLKQALRARLSSLTRRDAELVYEAILLASPGGLGAAETGDVRSGPAGTLLEMMDLARDRDLVARQYANGFEEVVDEGLPAIEGALRAGLPLEEAVILCHLTFLAHHGDSLIARKCGEEVSREAARQASRVLEAGWPRGPGALDAFDDLDQWLRADGNRRNPGAGADLTTASVFLALACGVISMPLLCPSTVAAQGGSRCPPLKTT